MNNGEVLITTEGLNTIISFRNVQIYNDYFKQITSINSIRHLIRLVSFLSIILKAQLPYFI
jgi:hypothetical protein